MQLFVQTNHCASRRHCGTCRNLEEGRQWREGLKKHFTLPKDEVDFTCPYGIPWKDGVIPAHNVVGSTPPASITPSVVAPAGCAPCQRKRTNA